MPAQTSRTSSPLAGALRANAKKKVDYGKDFSGLPGGISGGLAELVRAEIGTYKKGDNAGKRYFMAMGTVLSPQRAVETVKRFKGGRVEVVSQTEVEVWGRQTKVGPLPLCSTRKGDKGKDADENASLVVNELQKLGGEECTHALADPSITTDEQAVAALEAICAALVAAKPPIRFRFRTWQGDPSLAYPENPRVNEVWMGADRSASNGQAEHAAVQDESGNGQAEEPEQQSADAAAEAAPEAAGDDLADLLAKANAGDKPAQEAMIGAAVEAGIGKEDAENAATWQELAGMIEEAQAGAGQPEAEPEPEPEPEPEAAWAPLVGEQYDYFPSAKNKAGKLVKATKAVKATVEAVDEAKQTVTLKANKLLYKGVKWATIEPK